MSLFVKFLLCVLIIHFCNGERAFGFGDGATGRGNNFSYDVPILVNATTTTAITTGTEDMSSGSGRSARKTSGAIIFPNSTNGSSDDEMSDTSCRSCGGPKKIPLKFLREISNQNDISIIFEKYVSNVRVKDYNGTRGLFDLQDNPIHIDTSLGDAVSIRLAPNVPQLGTIAKFGFVVPGKNSVGTPSGPINFSGSPPATRRKPVNPGSGDISERFNPGVKEVEKVTKHASCEPELRTARVPGSDDPNMFIYPKCVRIYQCGGCCGPSLLSCEPTQKKPVEVQVQKFIYNDHGNLDYQESEKITMESHVACFCDCRVKSQDCSPLHRHDPDECQCVCKDEGRRATCQTDQLKQWNPFTCQCECRELRDCNSGFIFSPETCDCVLEPRILSNQNSRRRRDPWQTTIGRTRSH